MHIVGHVFTSVCYLKQEYMSTEGEDINTRWMEKKSYKMHEDEHKFIRCVGRRVGGEGEVWSEEWKVVVKMNCVLRISAINEVECVCVCVCEREECNKVVPAALLQWKAPACTISVESTLALNPWCFCAKVVYVRTPGTHPPHCKVLPQLQSLYPTHTSALCSQVPPKGTQKHKALVWMEHKRWRCGQ